MWVTYHSLNPNQLPFEQEAFRIFQQQQQQNRRPMVPRLRQTAIVPKTVVTLYHAGDSVQSPTPNGRMPLHLKLLNKLFRKSASIEPKVIQGESLWSRVRQLSQRDNILFLSLMFVDVLVNTVMLILNYTMLVVDFFDDIEWSTAVTKVEGTSTDSDSSSEHESSVLSLLSRKSIMKILNLVIYILIYVSQLAGFYGVLREIDTLIVTYTTVTSIQIIVLCFTIVLRPYWIPVCLLRLVLFTLAVREYLALSDRNVNQVWDWDAADAHLGTAASKSTQTESKKAESQPKRKRSKSRRKRSQTSQSSIEDRLTAVDRRNRMTHSMQPSTSSARAGNFGESTTGRKTRQNGGQTSKQTNSRNRVDETSIVEVMASISHVLNVPVSSFDTDSMDSSASR